MSSVFCLAVLFTISGSIAAYFSFAAQIMNNINKTNLFWGSFTSALSIFFLQLEISPVFKVQ